ncbi:hypothetical protein H072_1657 [Dactylellina haptotyla CBS 200.50]|uniref:Uncharacterized protein n=1 Tax=Dactylellina haptotyla (strain CBS 200.50) TaxID=1284197 RepID=S8AN59_DACHA|nr:hypothetical protein H072_1657 [Dactylellina haptotyla CBS 200.50]
MGVSSVLRLVAAGAVVVQCATIPWANFDGAEKIKLATRQILERQSGPSEYDFLFETLEPSTSMQWVDCYGTFKCSRLKVPLDYKDPSKGDAAVAVMMLPASPDVPFLGTIYSFPGGAGNPSEPFFISAAQIFRDYILSPGWNFVTWDARGAGQTTPTLTCFGTQDERYAFEQRGRALPALTKSTWPQYKSYYHDYNAKCQALSGDVIPHLGFIQTTRDLVSIANAMGVSKINLWGFSYGANIGALLTALYPERVGKLVLDSVGKIPERFSPGTSVEFELRDHSKMLEYFFRACHSTGSVDGCAFYSPTVAEMHTRITNIEKKLLTNPIVIANPPGNYSLENFRGDVFACLPGLAGSAQSLWPVLGYLLADVEATIAGAEPSFALNGFYSAAFGAKSVSPPVNGRQQGSADAQLGIPCTDSGPLGQISQKEFESLLSSFTRKDPHFGTTFLQNYLVCSEWTGVNVEKLDFSLLDQKPENTITFITHNIDPLGPLEGAKSMSRKFRNSRVIIIDAVGHTQLLGPNSTPGYMQVYALFNTPGYKAPRDLVVQVDDAARPFGYTGSTFDL